MNYITSIEEAISNGEHFYWDEEELAQGRSGGSRCPKCRKWTQVGRKRKNPQHTFLYDCPSCEITDPFARLWHDFNRSCNDEERDLYNKWLGEVRENLSNLDGCSELCTGKSKSKLKELIYKVPFFGV